MEVVTDLPAREPNQATAGRNSWKGNRVLWALCYPVLCACTHVTVQPECRDLLFFSRCH